MRSLLRFTVTVRGECSELIAVQNASVTVYRTGTSIAPVMWSAPTGGVAVANPLISDAQGDVMAWVDEDEDCIVDLVISSNGGTAYRAGQPGNLIAFATFTEAPVSTSSCGGTPGAPGDPGPPGGVTSVNGSTGAVTGLLVAANNLNDVASAPTARTSLGLGTAATHAHGDYDLAGAAAAAQAAAIASANGHSDAGDALLVPKALFGAFTVLSADVDDTPVPLLVPASTVVGRKASGGIVAMTMVELRALLGGSFGPWVDLGNLGSTETIVGTPSTVIQRVGVLDQPCTVTITMVDGDLPISFLPKQDATGGRALTFAGVDEWAGLVPYTGGRAALAHDEFRFEYVPTIGVRGHWLTEAVVPIRKAADEIVNNSAVLQNDNHFSIPLGPNHLVVGQLEVVYSVATAADMQAGFTAPAGATGSFGEVAAATTAATNGAYSVRSTRKTVFGSDVVIFGGAGVGSPLRARVAFEVLNGPTVGNLTFQWSQSTADASDATIYAGSFLIPHRLL